MERKVKMNLEGEIHTVDIQQDETILDAALRNGIDAPYACMSGTCHSCQAHLVSGEVQMEEAESLTEEEIAEGEILTCCSKVQTSFVEIKYPS